MLTTEDLKKYKDDRENMRDLTRRIEELETMLYDVRGVQLREKVVRSRESSSVQERALERFGEELEGLRDQYSEQRVELVERCRQIETIISRLPSMLQLILRLRYIDGLRWEDVAARTNYSFENIMVLHRKAQAELRRVQED